MTPEENKFRERRSAFADDDGESAEPRPETPEPADAGGPSGEPIIETPGGAPAGGSVAEGPATAREPSGEPARAGREPGRGVPGPGVSPGPDAAPAAPEPGPAEGSDAGIDFDRLDRMEIPEPSFYEILQPLEIQALQFLGVAPLTESGEKRVLPRWAKHVIDLLGLIEERTRGNLPQEEAAYLDRVLTELRTRYVKVTS